MDISVDKTGKITVSIQTKTGGAKGKVIKSSIEILPETALELSKEYKAAAYKANRVAKILSWDDEDRRRKALGELGIQ